MATPSLAMIPSAYADSKVYSVLPNNGDGDFTFNRDSSATRVGQNGLIQEVGFFGSQLVNSWTNNDFTSFASNGSNITQMVSSASGNNCYSLATFTSGKTYELKFTSSQNITAQIRISPNTSLTSAQVVLSNPTTGSNSIIFTATSNYSHIGFFANNSFTDTQITEFIAREIQGDQPRLNYDISNGVVQSCPSLLLEGASTNLVAYSEDFSNAYWTKSGATVTSGFVSPDGTTNAYKLVEDSANSRHFINSTGFTTPDTVYSASLFVKANGRNKIAFRENSITGNYASFNLSNGTVIATNGVSASIELKSNGWYRINYQITSGSSYVLGIELLSDSYTSGDPYSNPYQGNGSSGVYIFGAQVESQSYPTSYIPTNGSSQTRAAESCFGAGTASTFNSTEGVLYAEIKALNENGGNRYISLSNGTDLNRILLRFQDTDKVGCYVRSTSGSDADITKTSASISSNFLKVAVKWKTNDVALWVNGVEIGVDSSFTTFNANVLDRLNFAGTNGTSQYFYGNTKDLRVYNEALTDAQLQTLTTL